MLLYCSYIFITYALVVQHTLWHECNTNRPNARECTNAACATMTPYKSYVVGLIV